MGEKTELKADRIGHFCTADNDGLAELLRTAANELTPWMLNETLDFPSLNCALPAFLNEAANRLAQPIPQDRGSLPDGWRPIETAPKDGTEILIYGETDSWDDEERHAARMFRAHWWARERRWRGFGMPECDFKVTHWMPLPAPPSVHAEKG